MTDAELARLTAEKIMGWTLGSYGGWPCWNEGEVSRYFPEEWQPAQDITQAFEVMHKVVAKTGYFELFCDEVDINGVPGLWYCTLQAHPGPTGMTVGPDAPLAIVLAALQACHAEVSE